MCFEMIQAWDLVVGSGGIFHCKVGLSQMYNVDHSTAASTPDSDENVLALYTFFGTDKEKTDYFHP